MAAIIGMIIGLVIGFILGTVFTVVQDSKVKEHKDDC